MIDWSSVAIIGFIGLSVGRIALYGVAYWHHRKDFRSLLVASGLEVADYPKSLAYTRAKALWTLLSSLSFFIVLVGMVSIQGFSHFSIWWQEMLRGISSSRMSLYTIEISFILIMILLWVLFQSIFQYYYQFSLENRFGFNQMTRKTFLGDLIKSLLILGVLSWGLLSVLWVAIQWAGDAWYLWGAAFYIGGQVLLMGIFPYVIAPLFNKFIPLEEGELKEQLMGLARAQNFPVSQIFVMDGSKRSSHSNAFFTGIGRFRRIVLYDTLLNSLSTAQLKAVLAHEIGHYKYRHQWKQGFLHILVFCVVFYLFRNFSTAEAFFQAFGFQGAAFSSLILFVLFFFPSFLFLINPLMMYLSRVHEYQADAYAVKHTGAVDLIEALQGLSKKNLSSLYPHPLSVWFFYTHPPLIARISAIRGL